jgi:hypothetical protein
MRSSETGILYPFYPVWGHTRQQFSTARAPRSEREGGGIFVMGATGESVRRLTDFGYHPAWSPDGRQRVVSTLALKSSRRCSATWSEARILSADGGERALGRRQERALPLSRRTPPARAACSGCLGKEVWLADLGEGTHCGAERR